MLKPVAVTAVAVRSGLGNTPAEHQAALEAGRTGLRPLAGLPSAGAEWAALPGAWIEPRSVMDGDYYGPTTNLAVATAREAAEAGGWGPAELRESWLLVGTSRGNAAGWVDPWPGRRGHGRMGTSNSMHSELAVGVSIELGVQGPWHVLSNACASGLDAAGWGFWAVATGLAPRALVVAADLPLLPTLLRLYAQTGLLSHTGRNDPYSPETTGFLPAEGAAALLLEPAGGPRPAWGYLHGYWVTSDAYHPLGLPDDGAGIAEALRLALADLGRERVTAICPHASGTFAHGQAEQQALRAVFAAPEGPVSLHLMKPFTGHAIGASGALDLAILLSYLRQGRLPPNLPGLTGPGAPFTLPEGATESRGGVVLKISVGMGGHNAVVALSEREALA